MQFSMLRLAELNPWIEGCPVEYALQGVVATSREIADVHFCN